MASAWGAAGGASAWGGGSPWKRKPVFIRAAAGRAALAGNGALQPAASGSSVQLKLLSSQAPRPVRVASRFNALLENERLEHVPEEKEIYCCPGPAAKQNSNNPDAGRTINPPLAITLLKGW